MNVWMHFIVGGCLGMVIAAIAMLWAFWSDTKSWNEKQFNELDEILFSEKDPLIQDFPIDLSEVTK